MVNTVLLPPPMRLDSGGNRKVVNNWLLQVVAQMPNLNYIPGSSEPSKTWRDLIFH